MPSLAVVPMFRLIAASAHASMSGNMGGADAELAWSVVEVSPVLGSLSILVIGISGFYIAHSGALG